LEEDEDLCDHQFRGVSVCSKSMITEQRALQCQ
jgi:hypothetical protein